MALAIAPSQGAGRGARTERARPVPVTVEGLTTPLAERIADAEYEITWRRGTPWPAVPAAHQAPNRNHGFRTWFTDDGVRLYPRASDTQPARRSDWAVGWRLHRVGFGRELKPVASPRVFAEGRRAEFVRDGLVEWYVNDERGLEQGFVIQGAPAGAPTSAPLRLELALSGAARPRLSSDAQAVEFVQDGETVLRYAGLKSWDARGRALASRMELSARNDGEPSTLSLVVETAGAEYPVTVDPLVSNPAWTYFGGVADGRVGISLATADVNGDGFADVIVGAPYFDTGFTNAGRALVFHGSASGPSAAPDWVVDGTAESSLLGIVAGAGDVNGDGYEDVIVGAPNVANGEMQEGQASVYLGSSSGLSPTPVWTAEGNVIGADLGQAVAGAGDVNRDGYADVIIGEEDGVSVYFGSPSGPAGAPWTAHGNQSAALFGSSVTGGDFNGDGYSDVAVGAPLWDQGTTTDGGRVFVYHGSATGLPASATRVIDQPANTFLNNAHFGTSLAAVGDADGDGYADLLVGEPFLMNASFVVVGRASLYRGSATGLGSTPAWTTTGAGGSEFGACVAAAGDVNADGYADWLVGAPSYDAPAANSGYVYLYQGVGTGLGSVTNKPILTSNQAEGRFGGGLASGDVNGDGLSDVVVGADGYDGTLVDEGRITLHYGQVDNVGTTAVWRIESNIYGGRLGWAIAALGDVNGDGYADVAAGAPRIGNGTVYVYYGSPTGLPASWSWRWSSDYSYGTDSVGRSISSADVNGDGYSDVIVGDFNWPNPVSQEGRVLVFYGSASGLPASPSWSLESNVATIQFGMSVTGVGDVNGDGYEDVLIGAPFYTGSLSRQGAVFLYLGSPTGLHSTLWFVTGSTADEMLGGESSLGASGRAGDVNGDGYADIVLGETDWSNGQAGEGRLFGFYGGPTGPPTTPSWTFESNQAGANLGVHVTTVGDVNRDGFSDVLAGAFGYDNGQTDEGRIFVFHGGPAGLPASASWTWEINTANARICRAGSAGDVNADGFSDLVVYQYGYVFLGSPAGLSSSYTAAQLFPLATGAGDVDGDGIGDVLRGSSQYTSGQTDEGAISIHSTMPTAAGGRKVLPRMLRGGGSETPVQPWGRTHDPGGFRVRMNNTTSRGRGVVFKLEAEACPPATAFGSAACVRTVSPNWTELMAGSGTTETLTFAGLASRTLYRWRARTLYAPATLLQPGISPPPQPAHGPWRRVFAQAREADLRTDQSITVRFADASSSVDETNLLYTFVVSMTSDDGQPSLYDVTAQYETADGTATAGEDYTAKTATVSFPAGNTAMSQYPQLALSGGDGVSEGPETFSISLSSADATVGSPDVHVVTIVDSDPPLVSIGDTTVVEGSSGTTTATFPVTLNFAVDHAVQVEYSTVAGSASAGSDYLPVTGIVSFAPNETSQVATVTVNGDTLDEGDESFQVVLGVPTGANRGDATGVGTIENDDGPAGDVVPVFAATSKVDGAHLAWVYPAEHDTVRIRYETGSACVSPADPETSGVLLGDFSGTPGAAGSAAHGVTPGERVCYSIWADLGAGTWSARQTTFAAAIDNLPGHPQEPIAWAYTTDAATVLAPGLGGAVVLTVSNNGVVHAVLRGAGADSGLWPTAYRPRLLEAPAQARPPVIPLSIVPGAGAFGLLGSQDGNAYAVDTVSGGLKWQQLLLPAGSLVQAAPSALFSAYGAPFSLVVAATRNGSGFNRFYALDPATGAVIGTPYGEAPSDIGFVSGGATLDYGTLRAYFGSRSAGTPETLWCFDLSAGGLALRWARSAGEIETSPSLRGGVVYVSTVSATGDLMAYRADTGLPLWAAAVPTEVGGARGYITTDRLGSNLYLSTLTRVRALRDDGGSATPLWETVLPSPSTPVVGTFGGVRYLFVGGDDGRLYQLDVETGTEVKSLLLGAAGDVIGAPSLDGLNSVAYAGSSTGVVYAVKVPLP